MRWFAYAARRGGSREVRSVLRRRGGHGPRARGDSSPSGEVAGTHHPAASSTAHDQSVVWLPGHHPRLPRAEPGVPRSPAEWPAREGGDPVAGTPASGTRGRRMVTSVPRPVPSLATVTVPP